MKRSNPKMAANIISSEMGQDSPLDETNKDFGHIDQTMVQALAQEMMKFMKGKQIATSKGEGFSAYAHFASIVSPHSSICFAVPNNCSSSWIVDTGASDHITYDHTLFSSTTTLPKPTHVILPDRSIKSVTRVGQIPLQSNLVLQRVLYVPELKFNLLSIGKLLSDQPIFTTIYPHKCVFQDLITEKVVAVAPFDGGL